MPDRPSYYITTPIYYVNARPHIGHAYTTVVADAIARRKRAQGFDTWFLTGTDEHGQKIERSAKPAGQTPLEFATTVSSQFRGLWDRMGLSYDDYIRTTEERHRKGVQKLFQVLKTNGFIYKGSYTGQYCVSDELYVDAPPGAPAPIVDASPRRSAKRTTSSNSLRSNANYWSTTRPIQTSSARKRGATRSSPLYAVD